MIALQTQLSGRQRLAPVTLGKGANGGRSVETTLWEKAMTQQEDTHRPLIAECLSRMDVRSEILGYQVLQDGISGSRTYRLELDTGTAVLKITVADSAPYVFARARREFHLYHTLAGHIPLQVPRLLASCADDAFGVCILLAAYRPADPPQAWQEPEYLEMARELAAFHARYWAKTDELAALPWLRQPEPQPSEVQIEGARTAWRELLCQERLRDLLPAGSLQAIYDALGRAPEMDAALGPFPMTLCHGDCHLGNLLRDPQGRLVWADWQEVGLGRGPEDLSFLLQRAYPAGDAPLAPAVTATYQAALEAATGQRVPLDAVRRVMDIFELRIRLLEWPFYLGQAPVEWVSGMVRRVKQLAQSILPEA
jgi:aminoglycoside phosphotransferase (APT) family kinase protein